MNLGNKKIILAAAAAVVVIGAVTLGATLKGKDDSTELEKIALEQEMLDEMEDQQPEDTQEVTEQPEDTTPEPETVETVAEDKGLQKNAHPEINELITAYLQAKLECDEHKLAELVDDVSYLDMTDIQRRTERIEEYTTIDCYTLLGPEEGAYTVYVYSEVKVTGVETLVSGLDGFYVRTDEMGKMTITMGEVEEEIQEQLLANALREDVAQLIQEVNEKFLEEMENDEDLAAYYEELSIVDVLDETEPDPTDEVSTGE